MMTKTYMQMTDSELRSEYQLYLEDFDPSPYFAYDGYSSPMDFDTFCYEMIDREASSFAALYL
jgi:hypothetical protein